MITKEDIIRFVDEKLVWCSQFIEDGNTLNKIQKLQNNLQNYSFKQSGELLDLLKDFNINKPETIDRVLAAADRFDTEINK